MGFFFNSAKQQVEALSQQMIVHCVSPVVVRSASTILGVRERVDNASAPQSMFIDPFDSDEMALELAHKQFGDVAPVSLTVAEIRGWESLPSVKIPYHSLQRSNFLQLYDACPKKPDADFILNLAPPALKVAFIESLRAMDYHVGKAATRMWTGHELYRAVNAALLSDKPGLLQHFMPLIRAINNYLLAYHPDTALTTRRQSRMTRAEAKQVQVGATYRLGMYVATSLCPNDNPGVGGKEVVWKFSIPKGCFQAWDISKVSFLGKEKEVLLVPYSPVVITNKVEEGGRICIYADVPRDGKAYSLDLPTICA